MFSKYVREILMSRFNLFWGSRGIRSTAGYPEDARRWIAESGMVRRALGISDAQLIRSR
jgi:hypothetical protein